MSDLRAALETALLTLGWQNQTAWDNATFVPVAETPYQRATLIPGTPINDEYGSGFNDQGFLQVSLHYPPGAGAKDAEDRALAIRSAFHRGATFPHGAIVVKIMKTPAILPAMDDDQGRYVVPVSIEYLTSIQN